MITTMMWVIIILVLLMILVLKITKKYHISWCWCQNIMDNMVGKKDEKIRARPSPPLFGQCPKEIDFCYERCSLRSADIWGKDISKPFPIIDIDELCNPWHCSGIYQVTWNLQNILTGGDDNFISLYRWLLTLFDSDRWSMFTTTKEGSS